MSDKDQVFPQWRSLLGETPESGRFVAKRSGKIDTYDRQRIFNAVEKAFKAVKGHAD